MILFAIDISCRRRVTSLSIVWRLDIKKGLVKHIVSATKCVKPPRESNETIRDLYQAEHKNPLSHN